MDEEFSKFYSEFSELEAQNPPIEEATSSDTNKIAPKSPKNNENKVTNNEDGDNDNKTSQKDQKIVESEVNKEIQDGNQFSEHKTSQNDQKIEETKKNEDGQDDNQFSEHTRYEGTECIYTNPESKEEFVWSAAMKQWVPRGYIPVFDGNTYKYTDKKGVTHRWDSDKSSWIKTDEAASENVYGFDGENHTYTDAKDNTVYIWDKDKNAWFPKVDEDFMARYQMSYGFVDNTTKEEPKPEEKKAEKRKPSDPSWFEMEDDKNTKVYVTHLPEDIGEQEFIDLMQKCGLIAKDIKTGKFKIKLYKEPDGTLKGDALCDYIKVESVALALNVLDGCDVRGKKITVQRAKFQMKGDYNPALKPKKKRKKDKEQEMKIQQKLLDWRPDKLRGEREKHERTVVVKNLFDPKIFDENVELILEYTEDIRSEATKCGKVTKVTLYDKNPEGVATITFSDAEEADICIKLLNNRWFGKRKIIAETWDGKTKYKVVESVEETKRRLEKWNNFLESEDRVKK